MTMHFEVTLGLNKFDLLMYHIVCNRYANVALVMCMVKKVENDEKSLRT